MFIIIIVRCVFDAYLDLVYDTDLIKRSIISYFKILFILQINQITEENTFVSNLEYVNISHVNQTLPSNHHEDAADS